MCINHSYLKEEQIKQLNNFDINISGVFTVLSVLDIILFSKNLEAIEYLIDAIYSSLRYWSVDIQDEINLNLNDDADRNRIYKFLFEVKTQHEDYSKLNTNYDYICDVELNNDFIIDLLKDSEYDENDKTIGFIYENCNNKKELMDIVIEMVVKFKLYIYGIKYKI